MLPLNLSNITKTLVKTQLLSFLEENPLVDVAYALFAQGSATEFVLVAAKEALRMTQPTELILVWCPEGPFSPMFFFCLYMTSLAPLLKN